jgi:IS5 family transposase
MRDRHGQHQGDKRGPLTGPNPTDRGKSGSKIHLITDRNGLPLSLSISAANMHDSLGLQPLVRGIPYARRRSATHCPRG